MTLSRSNELLKLLDEKYGEEGHSMRLSKEELRKIEHDKVFLAGSIIGVPTVFGLSCWLSIVADSWYYVLPGFSLIALSLLWTIMCFVWYAEDGKDVICRKHRYEVKENRGELWLYDTEYTRPVARARDLEGLAKHLKI